MAKAKTTAALQSASTRKASRKTMPAPPGGGQAFPPLSISSRSFLSDGSDAEFRRLIYHVLSASAMLLKSRERFASYIGVTAPQYSMMVAIGEANSATIGQIAQSIHVSSPFVTAEVGKLVKRGIIDRQPNEADARSSILTLSDQGKALIQQLGPYRRMANDIIFGSFSPAEAKQFSKAIEQLYANCHRALHELDSPRWQNGAANGSPPPRSRASSAKQPSPRKTRA